MIKVNGKEIKFAAANGLHNARKIIERKDEMLPIIFT